MLILLGSHRQHRINKLNEFLAEQGALIGALVVTCVITAGTPGPNNFIVLMARLSNSTKAAFKAYLGVRLGFPFMVLAVSLIVLHYGDSIIEQLTIVKYLGIAFLLYLSAKLFMAPPSELSRQAGMAPGFIFVVLFQSTNPKA